MSRFLSTLSLRRATASGFFIGSRSQFLSTLSLRRATFNACHAKPIHAFLSTLSLRRATRGGGLYYLTPRSISIHALLAESDSKHKKSPCKTLISIHALLAESDSVFFIIFNACHAFLSTLSLRRATHFSIFDFLDLSFLSTLSLRRATPANWFDLWGWAISIHALLAESDLRR